ncbi:glutaredoxin family protein [Cytobacillus spongiae]|uniref:glutaredoxin family protein n=1 Tax=Cytobacillus spongiae TaxID=2901381 RepID=UPI001F356F54|nr:glutaredoxin family protein [Cytobacillus spongiae]UII54156.1 glutaredoxin family protein [Cytobacillus spongiae]
MEATLYTINGCEICVQARNHLERLHLSYQEINILEEPNSVTTLIDRLGEVITPVLIIKNQTIIGKDILNLQT